MLDRLLVTLPAALIVAGALAGTVVASAAAAPTAPRPAAAQGHPYRHGVVLKHGKSAQSSSPATSPAPANNLSFGGAVDGVGVVTGQPKVYLVFWGSQWGTQGTDSNNDVTLSGDPEREAPYLQEFLKGLGTGGETWSGVMTQYCQGITAGATTCPSSSTQHVGYPTGGALAGTWVDESSAAPAAATGTQLAQEAVDAAVHFGDFSSNSQYVIVSPTGTNPDDWENPVTGFCAWHDYTGDSTLDGGGAVPSPSGEPPVAFTNLPYLTDAGASCGEDFVNSGSAGTLDGVSIVEGHEFAETITDTFPSGGWTDSNGEENADKCAWKSSGQGAAQDITLGTGSFAVQSTWANDYNSGSGGCEISHPTVVDPGVNVSNPGPELSTDNTPITPLKLTATDSNSQALTWLVSGLPAGLSFNSLNDQITGTPSSVGNYTVTVRATDSTNTGEATFTWTVARRSTSTSLSCTPSSVAVGAATTCTAVVSDSASGIASAPTGTVDITPGGSCALAGTGVASCQVSYTPSTAGSQTVTAAYQGDSTHFTSNSSGLSLTVTPTTNAGTNPGNPPTTTAGPPTGSPSGASGGGVTASVCPAPTGRVTHSTLGLVKLGMTSAQARAAYIDSPLRSSSGVDVFCLRPTGVRVGYATTKLLTGLSATQRRALRGRVVWIITANPYFKLGSIHPGSILAPAARALRTAVRVKLQGRQWYLMPGSGGTVVVAVRGGVVQELGIVNKSLIRSTTSDRRILAGLS